MADEGFKRKLTAILSADAVEYSRLMGEDEEATVRTLTAYREVIKTLIQQHNGKVLDSPGDNLLAEFVSVVDAVQCAVAVQKEINSRNNELSENRRMQFRIGINLGDVIQEEERIYGDGVNIAARLEGLSEPGGICISKTAFDHIESKLPYGYEFLGDQTVKNIAKPVGAYRVLMEPRVTVAGEPEVEKPALGRRKALLIGVAALLVVAVAVGIWQFYMRRPTIEPATVEKMAFPLPDKPSVAVLAFDNMSGNPELEYISDGISENIISALSKISKLFVIARNSTFTYKGKPVKVRQVSEELGVRYVVEGSFQKSGDRVRITAQLIDALKGNHLWSETYDRDLKDIFTLQDDITKKILTALQVKLTQGEQAHALARGTDNLEAYLKFLQARENIFQVNKESNALARQMVEEAIALDPEYAAAYALLGSTHMMDVWVGSSKSPKDSFAKAIELQQKALALDNSLAVARGRLGFLYTIIGQHDRGVAEAEQAVELDPNSANVHHLLGTTLRFAGRQEEAIPVSKKAIRLEPIAPGTWFINLGISYAFTGQCEEAIAACEEAIRRSSNNLIAHAITTEAYGMCGKEEEARATAKEVLRINPKFSVEKFTNSVPYKNQADKERTVEALRNAGLK